MESFTYKIAFAAFMAVVMSFSVAAFGIVMPYWEGRPLVMEPGEVKEIALTLQNVGDNDITLEVTLTKGFEIAEISDSSKTYLVPKGNIDTKINMKVTIPNEEQIGNEHEIGISIKEAAPKGGGMVQLTNAIDKSFKVVVGSKPALPKPEAVGVPEHVEKPGQVIPLLVIVIILAALVVAFYFLRKKNQEAKPKRKTKFK